MTSEKPTLVMEDSGEHFEFLNSAHSGDGTFRFRWTLAPGRKGPPPHSHPHETETFAIVSGRMHMWIGGKKREVGPGDVVAVPPETTHRFHNFGSEPVVVDVSLDGPLQEDILLSMVRLQTERGTVSGGTLFLHALDSVRSEGIYTFPVLNTVLRALAWLLRAPKFPPLERWDESPRV
ncbi:MAG: cupin domain-containing protein [Myxococcales bacterium]|nr:cupin domain-containing protein [Myxococcales bacterium]